MKLNKQNKTKQNSLPKKQTNKQTHVALSWWLCSVLFEQSGRFESLSKNGNPFNSNVIILNRVVDYQIKPAVTWSQGEDNS